MMQRISFGIYISVTFFWHFVISFSCANNAHSKDQNKEFWNFDNAMFIFQAWF